MSPRRRLPSSALASMLAATVASGCGGAVVPPVLLPPDATPEKSELRPFLKVHMKSGEMYLLDSWSFDPDGWIDGSGTRFSVRRAVVSSGRQSIATSEAALLETDQPESAASGGAACLGIMSMVVGAISAVCAVDPKSCFGSCPTFYLDEADTGRPLAEGFSSSIARALESRDVDALFGLRPPEGRRLSVVMRNEALETHAVRRVRLLAAPRPNGGRVLAAPDHRFHQAFELRPPDSCRAPEGDCRAAVAGWDGAERASKADDRDLATREEIELAFPPASGQVGLVIGARQTLLSTFLFYQTMAHFGRGAGEFLASVERGEVPATDALAMAHVLGGIDASVADGGSAFVPVGSFDESGPIAGDVRVLPFEARAGGPLRVRLRLAKGHWRLDYVALARLGAAVTPAALDPVRLARNGREDERARRTWRHGDGHVVTVPGDLCRMEFQLPRPGRELELFLESEGYYYEWMRREWLAEEDPELALLSVAAPEEALRRLAGAFKHQEPSLEGAFWASRFRR